MNYLKSHFIKYTILFSVFINFSFLLSAQSKTIALFSKDSIDLQAFPDAQFSVVTPGIDMDSTLALLRNTLESCDTSLYFRLCQDVVQNHYLENRLYKDGIVFLNTCRELSGFPETHHGDFNNSFGECFAGAGLYFEALKYFHKSKDWYEQFDKKNAGIPVGNIARVYYENEDYKQALKFNEIALRYSLRLKDKRYRSLRLIPDYCRSGKIHAKLKQYTYAEKYFELALTEARNLQDKKMLLKTIRYALPLYAEIGKKKTCEHLVTEGDRSLKASAPQSFVSGDYLLTKLQYFVASGQTAKAIPPGEINGIHHALKSRLLAYAAAYYASVQDLDNVVLAYENLLRESAKEKQAFTQQALHNFDTNFFQTNLKEKNKKLHDLIQKRKRTIYILLPGFILISSLLMLQLVNKQRYKKLNELLQSKTRELENSNANLARSNEELERFAFIASHDLKTPLGNIINFTGLLEKRLQVFNDEKSSTYLAFIKNGSIHLNNLLNDTMAFSSLSKLDKNFRPQPIDLYLLLCELQHTMADYIAERNAAIIFSSTLPVLQGDYTAVSLLFENLLENGIKYNNSQTPTIKIYTREQGRSVSIFVEDNGIGIPEKYHDDVFVMFSRLHNKTEYEGSGLGLSICKKITEKLQSRIFIHSKNENGSIFEIRIPANLIVREKVN